MRKATVPVLAAAWFTAIAQTAAPPPVKEGLWSVHMTTVDTPSNAKSEATWKLCRSHAYDEHMQSIAKNIPGCHITSETLNAGVYHMEMECDASGTKVQAKNTTTVEGDASYRSESSEAYTPPLRGVSQTTMTLEESYLGTCPAGVAPGDRISQDGKVTHTWQH